jgi:hypothetical protein
MRTCLRGLLVGIVFVVSMVFFVRGVLGVEFGSRQSLVRVFNKHVLNPLAPWLAGRRQMY